MNAARRTSRSSTHRRGTVMIITVFALLLLAALLFYVLNLGRQVNRRVMTQNSADSAAAAGGGWIARGMNQIAMNNIASARLIAAINTVDAMPQAVTFTLEDQIAAYEGLGSELPAVGSIPKAGSILFRALEAMHLEIADEITTLQPVVALLNDEEGAYLDVRDMTYYDAPGGQRGRFWAALESLEQLSLATVDSLAPAVQINSQHGGQANLARGDADTGTVLLPIEPTLPFQHRKHTSQSQRTHFRDFDRPVRHGLLPRDLDDPVVNRGPFDAVFGWRSPWPSRPGGTAANGSGNTPISRDALTPVTPGPWFPTHYTVYGTQTWVNGLISGFGYGHLIHSRIGSWTSIITRIKALYLWQQVDQLRNVIDPNWIVGWEDSQLYFDSRQLRRQIHETAFVGAEIRSKHPANHPLFMSPGTWMWAPHYTYGPPHVIRTRGAQDPREWDQAVRMSTGIWRDEFEEDPVYADPMIGITPMVDEEDEPVLQNVYRVDYFVFLGINIGTPVNVRNPHNFEDMNSLPGPVMLDHSRVNPSPQSRRQYLTFLAVTTHDDHARLWPSRFDGGKPYGHMVATTEARVFNDHSFDLWTPMWQTQLQPVQEYDRWADMLAIAAEEGVETESMSSDEVEKLSYFILSTQSLADSMLNH